MRAQYLCGSRNVHADRLSRLPAHYEWQLNPELFQILDDMWGPHTVDRFASHINALLPRYNARFFDPGSEATDALAQMWSRENNFVNAPIRLIPQVLNLIVEQKASATIIAP